MAVRDSIGSNETELFAALHTDPKKMPVDAVWFEKEPNSYDAFGESQSRVARSPINASRMKKKPVVIGSDTETGFNQDITAENAIQDCESFLFAAKRSKGDVKSTTIVADGYTVAAGGAAFKAGNLIIVEGENVNPVNLGLKVLTVDGSAAKVLFPTTAEVGAVVRIRKCGHQFAAGKATITIVNGLPKLNTIDFDATTLGIIPGETLFIGGDDDANKFATVNNAGWVRVIKIEANGLTFDKTDEEFAADNGAGKLIRLFFGTVVKNEKTPALQKMFAWAFRRRLGRADDASAVVQSEVTYGNVAGELSINIPEQDKITCDVTYMGRGYQTYADDALVDPNGTVQRVAEADVFTSAKDSRRLRIGVYPKIGDLITSKPKLLFPATREMTIEINNNITANKAITYAGTYSHTPGFFEVMLSATCYFNDVSALKSVSDNLDLTFDFAAAKANKGFAIDIPLFGASTEGLEIEQNEAIILELEGEAADGTKYNSALGHAIMFSFFPYLPNAAEI